MITVLDLRVDVEILFSENHRIDDDSILIYVPDSENTIQFSLSANFERDSNDHCLENATAQIEYKVIFDGIPLEKKSTTITIPNASTGHTIGLGVHELPIQNKTIDRQLHELSIQFFYDGRRIARRDYKLTFHWKI